MTTHEAIETIKVAIAEVEWNYPLDYAIAFETAIEALETVERQRENVIKEFAKYLIDKAENDVIHAPDIPDFAVDYLKKHKHTEVAEDEQNQSNA